MAANPQGTVYGGVNLDQALQAAEQPGELGYIALNQLAKQHALNEQQREAMFSVVNQQAATPVTDLSRISEAESALNSFLNQASAHLINRPVNPAATGSNIIGSLAGGLATPLAIGAALSSAPVTAPLALGGIAAYGGLSGFNEARNEALAMGQQPSLGAGLTRGALEAGLTFLPGGNKLDDLLTQGKILARNAGIAGALEAPTSLITQSLQTGGWDPDRLVSDVAGQVGAQLGGDVVERLRLNRGMRQRPAFDMARTTRVRPDVARTPEGALVGGVSTSPAEQAATELADTLQTLEMLKLQSEAMASRQARNVAGNKRLQAANEPDPAMAALLKEQAKRIDSWADGIKVQNKAAKAIESIQNRRSYIQGYELQGNLQELKVLSRLGRKAVVAGETPEVKAEAAALQQEADAAIARLEGVKPQAPAKPSKAEQRLAKTLEGVEKLERDYNLIAGEGGANIDDGSASVRRLLQLRNKAEKVATDADAPEWVREYSQALKETIDSDIETIKTQELTKKAIAQAKERTAVAEQRRQVKERPTGLKQLKQDITQRSKEAKAEEKATAKQAKTEERQKKQEARKAAIKKADKATAIESIKREFRQKAYKLDTVHEGMTETPNDIRKKLDAAMETGEVVEVDYFAEKTGANITKPILKRKVTIVSAGRDAKGNYLYRTIDQENGDIQTRKLFDASDDSRFTHAAVLDEEARYLPVEGQDNAVLDRETGEILQRSGVQQFQSTQSQIDEAVDLVNTFKKAGMNRDDMIRVLGESIEARQRLYKSLTGKEC